MLAELPMLFILIGLAAYVVLAGSDFGAGFWTLSSGGGETSPAATRDFARRAMGPVWEANHVWLIFLLVVCWTAYPVAFASMTSTLAAPLFLAAVGIILRGTAYALRGQLDRGPGGRAVERLFALSSILTPFALGAAVGGIASGRVPVGNAAGDPLTSWLNPTSAAIGTLAVATSAYLAAVYLAADARRLGRRSLQLDFRVRALWAGAVAGGAAVVGLAVVRHDAPALWHGLSRGGGLVMVAVSGGAGLLTLVLVGRSRFGAARLSAGAAVASIVAGWALAQEPYLLPGLTLRQAAAGHDTLLAVVVAVAAGAVVLVPALAVLFSLFLRGRLTAPGPDQPARPETDVPVGRFRPHLRGIGGLALACLVTGVPLTVLGDSPWPTAAGLVCLCGSAVSTFVLASAPSDAPTPERS